MSLFYFLVTQNIFCSVICQIDIRALLGNPNVFSPVPRNLDKNSLSFIRQQFAQNPFENEETFGAPAAFGSPTSNFNSVVHNVKSRNGEIEIQQWDQLNPIHSGVPLAERSYKKQQTRWISDFLPARSRKSYPRFDEEFFDEENAHNQAPSRQRRPYRNRQYFLANPPKPKPLLIEPSETGNGKTDTAEQNGISNVTNTIGLKDEEKSPEDQEKNMAKIVDKMDEDTKKVEEPEEDAEHTDHQEDVKHTKAVERDETSGTKKGKKVQKDVEELLDGEVPLDEAKTQALRVPGKSSKNGKKKKSNKLSSKKFKKTKVDDDEGKKKKKKKKKDDDDEGKNKKKKKKEKNDEDVEEDEESNEENKEEQEEQEEIDDDALVENYDEFEEEELDDYLDSEEDEETKKKDDKKKRKNDKAKKKNKKKKNFGDGNGKLIAIEGEVKVAKTVDGHTKNRNKIENGKHSRKSKPHDDDYDYDTDYNNQDSEDQNEESNKCDFSAFTTDVPTDSYDEQIKPTSSNGKSFTYEKVDYNAVQATDRMSNKKWNYRNRDKSRKSRRGGTKCSFKKDVPLSHDETSLDSPMESGSLTADTKKVISKGKPGCSTEKDDYPTKCLIWKSAGYCETNQATRFLWCRKTCLCEVETQKI